MTPTLPFPSPPPLPPEATSSFVLPHAESTRAAQAATAAAPTIRDLFRLRTVLPAI